MSYIGSAPTTSAFPFDQFSGNASTTAFTLSQPPASTTSIVVYVSGQIQNPNTYSVSNSTLTFITAPISGTNNIGVIFLGLPAIVGIPSAGTVGVAQLSATGTPSATTFLTGNNTWAAPVAAAGGFSNMQVFTTTGTFTVPAGITKVKVTVVGGGGGGGGLGTAGCAYPAGGGGGGGGSAIGIINGLVPTGTVTVTIGTAGAGGRNNGCLGETNGSSGGTSSFGAYCSATGGGGGIIGSYNNGPGGGGIGSGGDLNIKGSTGGTGGAGTYGGGLNIGGSSFLGGSSYGIGATYGGGGAGGLVQNGFASAGAAGVVIVEY